MDTSGYFPKQVAASAGLLSKSKQYVFISSISVFSDLSKPGVDETRPVGELKDPNADKITEGNYGPLKAACERAAEAAMPGRVTNVRPGLIVGPERRHATASRTGPSASRRAARSSRRTSRPTSSSSSTCATSATGS